MLGFGKGATRVPDLVPFGKPAGDGPAVLVLPGGFVRGRGRYWKFVETELENLCTMLAEAQGPSVYLLRYRCRGWNGTRADTLVDARWALEQIRQHHGDRPVSVIGNSLGGRAAFLVADAPNVVSVIGVAPWLLPEDPVEQLATRKVLILHGSRDRSAAGAERSLAYAERARAVVPDLARFEVPRSGHYLIRRQADCWAATSNFVLATLGHRELSPATAQAMSGSLSTPLPQQFPL